MSDDAKDCSYIIRALNYHMGLQEFTVVMLCKLQSVFEVAAVIKSDKVQVAICGVTSSRHAGTYVCTYEI